MSQDVVLLLVPFIFVAAGAVLIGYARWSRGKAKASESWSQAVGTVTSLSVRKQGSAKRGHRHAPLVAYSYEVGGRPYAGTRLAFGNTEQTSDAAARRVIAAYAVGGSVTVFYDPADPAASTLSSKAAGTVILEVLGWVCLAAAGIVAAFRLIA